MYKWFIVFPCGDRTRVSLVLLDTDECDRWALASRQSWPDTPEGLAMAQTYVLQLANTHGLICGGSGVHQYLD